MNNNVQSNNLVTQYRDGSISVPLDNILTAKGHIYKGMKAIIIHGGDMDMIEVIDHCIEDGYLHLKIKNLVTGKISDMYQILEKENDLFLWYIIGLGYLYSMINKQVLIGMVQQELLDFEF